MHKQGYIKNGEVIPSMAGLALYANCSRSNLYNYASSSEEFKDMLELIKERQKVELINKGLKGEFNASIAKLMLAYHGYFEKQTLYHQSMGNSFIAKSKLMRIELVPRSQKNGNHCLSKTYPIKVQKAVIIHYEWQLYIYPCDKLKLFFIENNKIN
ncbi:terminase small subunit [Gilliamella apicola]|uniref:terminase small subunit n=1 Tax=Gilliamella apicola TaxID=1196095 RepID=UPI000ABC9AE9|nr:terminase small subunit [Gilliamella apicola]